MSITTEQGSPRDPNATKSLAGVKYVFGRALHESPQQLKQRRAARRAKPTIEPKNDPEVTSQVEESSIQVTPQVSEKQYIQSPDHDYFIEVTDGTTSRLPKTEGERLAELREFFAVNSDQEVTDLTDDNTSIRFEGYIAKGEESYNPAGFVGKVDPEKLAESKEAWSNTIRVTRDEEYTTLQFNGHKAKSGIEFTPQGFTKPGEQVSGQKVASNNNEEAEQAERDAIILSTPTREVIRGMHNYINKEHSDLPRGEQIALLRELEAEYERLLDDSLVEDSSDLGEALDDQHEEEVERSTTSNAARRHIGNRDESLADGSAGSTSQAKKVDEAPVAIVPVKVGSESSSKVEHEPITIGEHISNFARKARGSRRWKRMPTAITILVGASIGALALFGAQRYLSDSNASITPMSDSFNKDQVADITSVRPMLDESISLSDEGDQDQAVEGANVDGQFDSPITQLVENSQPAQGRERVQNIDLAMDATFVGTERVHNISELMQQIQTNQRLQQALRESGIDPYSITREEICASPYGSEICAPNLNLTPEELREMFPIGTSMEMYAIHGGNLILTNVTYEGDRTSYPEHKFSVNEIVYYIRVGDKVIMVREECVNPAIAAKTIVHATATPTASPTPEEELTEVPTPTATATPTASPTPSPLVIVPYFPEQPPIVVPPPVEFLPTPNLPIEIAHRAQPDQIEILKGEYQDLNGNRVYDPGELIRPGNGEVFVAHYRVPAPNPDGYVWNTTRPITIANGYGLSDFLPNYIDNQQVDPMWREYWAEEVSGPANLLPDPQRVKWGRVGTSDRIDPLFLNAQEVPPTPLVSPTISPTPFIQNSPTPTNTPTVTPTGTRPTETSTSTVVTSTPTETSTVTPTGTRPTETATSTSTVTPTGTRPTETSTSTPTPSSTPRLTIPPQTPIETPTIGQPTTTETPAPTSSRVPTFTPETPVSTPTVVTETPTSTTRPTIVPQTPISTPTIGQPTTTETPVPTSSRIPTFTPDIPVTLPPTSTSRPTIVPQTAIPTPTFGQPKATETPAPTAQRIFTATPAPTQFHPTAIIPPTARPTSKPGA